MKTDMTLEQAMKKLEDITKRMENEELSVEESLKYFEEGTKLIAFCKEKLTASSLKITELTENMQVEPNENI